MKGTVDSLVVVTIIGRDVIVEVDGGAFSAAVGGAIGAAVGRAIGAAVGGAFGSVRFARTQVLVDALRACFHE